MKSIDTPVKRKYREAISMEGLKLMENDVKKFIERLKEEERSQNTIEKYARDLRKLIHFLDGRKLTKNLMITFKGFLMKNYKPASVNSILAAVATFLKYSKLEKFIVKRLKYQRKIFCPKDKELTYAQYRRLIEAAELCGKHKLSIIMQVICSTGIRVSELKFFTVESIKSGSIDVTNKGKTRTIFIPKNLKKILNLYCAQNGIRNGIIFMSKNGECIGRKTIWSQMKKICKSAGIEMSKVFPHNLRHLFARTYYQIRRDISMLADILGHSSVETTRTYLVSTGRQHERDINKMGLILGYRHNICYAHK